MPGAIDTVRANRPWGLGGADRMYIVVPDGVPARGGFSVHGNAIAGVAARIAAARNLGIADRDMVREITKNDPIDALEIDHVDHEAIKDGIGLRPEADDARGLKEGALRRGRWAEDRPARGFGLDRNGVARRTSGKRIVKAMDDLRVDAGHDQQGIPWPGQASQGRINGLFRRGAGLGLGAGGAVIGAGHVGIIGGRRGERWHEPEQTPQEYASQSWTHSCTLIQW